MLRGKRKAGSTEVLTGIFFNKLKKKKRTEILVLSMLSSLPALPFLSVYWSAHRIRISICLQKWKGGKEGRYSSDHGIEWLIPSFRRTSGTLFYTHLLKEESFLQYRRPVIIQAWESSRDRELEHFGGGSNFWEFGLRMTTDIPSCYLCSFALWVTPMLSP